MLVKVSIPAHTFVFYQAITEFARIDPFYGREFFNSMFSFHVTRPLNPTFELFGFNNLNFVLMSGSYFVIQLGVLAYFGIRMLLNKIALKHSSKSWARKLGPWAHEDSYGESLR